MASQHLYFESSKTVERYRWPLGFWPVAWDKAKREGVHAHEDSIFNKSIQQQNSLKGFARAVAESKEVKMQKDCSVLFPLEQPRPSFQASHSLKEQEPDA